MAVYKRPGSPFYWIEFQFKGRRIRESSGTELLRRAEAVERQLRRQLQDQLVTGRAALPQVTVKEAVERYITTHLKTKRRRLRTAKADMNLLAALIDRIGEEVLLTELTTASVSDFKGRLIGMGLKPASVNKYLASLKAILRKAHREWEVLPSMPMISLLPLNNNRMRWLTQAEEEKLLAACKQTSHLHDLVVFLIDTGARLSEATGLTWGDVHLERTPRPVVVFMNTKSGKPRGVPLTERVTAMLQRLRTMRPQEPQNVFLQRFPGYSWRGTKPNAKAFSNPHGSWKNAVKRAGLTDVVMHDLRHTFASRLVQRGVPLLDISKLLGHASLTMTMRYAHLAPDDLNDAIAALDWDRSPQTKRRTR